MQNSSAIMQNLDWGDIPFFLAVARLGSVTQAAEQLGVNYTTVARRLASLEQDIGARLFDRGPNGHVMTAAAEAVFHRAEQMEDHAFAFGRAVHGQDQQLSGLLRLTAGDISLNYLILPHLDEFTSAYPDIQLEIDSSDRALDLELREADVAVRATSTAPPPNMIGLHIGRMRFSPFVSKAYLRQHPDLNSEEARALLWKLEGHNPPWVQRHVPKARRGLWFDSTVVMAQALKLGLGFGGLAYFVGLREPELVPVFDDEHAWNETPEVHLWLLHHPDLRTTAKVRVFRDFLKHKLLEQRALVQGPTPPPDS